MSDTTTTTAAPAASSAAAALTTGAPAPADATTTAPAPAPAEPAPAGLTMPGKDATPEQWSEFYGKLGRPETADGYELPVPEGDDGAFAKSAAGWMHEAGVPKDMAGKLAAKWNAHVAEQKAAADKAEGERIKALDTKNTAEQAELKTELGERFDAQMELGRRAARQFGGEQAGDIITAIEDKIGYKATMQFFMAVGAGLGEHDAGGQAQGGKPVERKTDAQVLYGGS